jgi:hypothetical protein
MNADSIQVAIQIKYQGVVICDNLESVEGFTPSEAPAALQRMVERVGQRFSDMLAVRFPQNAQAQTVTNKKMTEPRPPE